VIYAKAVVYLKIYLQQIENIVKTQKIIIADNNKYFRQGLKAILQNIDIDNVIAEAKDGNEAVDQMISSPADIVFVEVVLNGLDGIELTRKIKAEHPETSVIAFSSLEDKRYVNMMIGAGANGYLFKSSDNYEILRQIIKDKDGAFFMSDIAISQYLEFEDTLY
jgi:DNA-binding NarL/FixJ family response regulator